MTHAKAKSIEIRGLGNVSVIRDSDAIRVAMSSKKKVGLAQMLLDQFPHGIRLVQDESGYLIDGGGITGAESTVSKRGSRPVVFSVDRTLQKRHVRFASGT